MWERPLALQAELALTLKVLGTVTDPALGDVLEQPLHMLRHIHAQLQACVSPWSLCTSRALTTTLACQAHLTAPSLPPGAHPAHRSPQARQPPPVPLAAEAQPGLQEGEGAGVLLSGASVE